MSDQPNCVAPTPAGPLVLNLQYTKDLSFEVPGAPDIFLNLQENPRLDVALDVNARKLQEEHPIYEVTFQVRCDAKLADGRAAFIVELSYCGIFTVNVAPDVLEAVLLVECPRLLFPFARNILGDVTRDGGFPPVLLTPIDFVALWQNRRAQASQSAAATA